MSNTADRPVGEVERELARQFMRDILMPEAEDSPNLKFVDNWEQKAESFVVDAGKTHDEATVTGLLAILVNASKALADQVDQDPSSPIRNVAHPLFACIRVLALKYSTDLREAVEQKKEHRSQNRKKQARRLIGRE